MDYGVTHTPGPWKQSCESIDPDWHIVTTQGGAVVANVFAPQSANARLIAAAPDLLAAVEAFLAYNDKDGDDVRMMLDYGEALRLARTAIAKARGNTE
jgi:hypothetical protein